MAGTSVYPLHRPEIYEALALGDRAMLQAMSTAGRTMVLNPRATLIEAGAAHDRVYRLRSGWLARTRRIEDERRQIIDIFLPGDLVGTKATLLSRQPDSIEALTTASVDSLDQAEFRELATTNSAVALRVMFQLAEDERRLHNWVTALGQGDAAERLAAMVLDLRLRLRRIGLVPRNSFHLPLTQREIGDHLGITIVHVNRTIRRLREDGLLSITKSSVVIHDLAGLQKLARPMLDIFEREAVEASSTVE